MDQKARLERQSREWQEMQRLGHVRWLFQNVLLLIGLCTVVNDLLLLLNTTMGWHFSASWLDILLFGGVGGGLSSELHWSDQKRKFRIPPPEEDWMAR